MISLESISPVDGRYFDKVRELKIFFSEYALIRYRVFVETQYLIALKKLGLNELSGLSAADVESITMIYTTFNLNDAEKVKEIEKTTNHDVKAVEYYIKEKWTVLDFHRSVSLYISGLHHRILTTLLFP